MEPCNISVAFPDAWKQCAPGGQAVMAATSLWCRKIVTMPSCPFFKAQGISVLPSMYHMSGLKSLLSQTILTTSSCAILAVSKSLSRPRYCSGSGLTSLRPSIGSPARVNPFPGAIVRCVWPAYFDMSGSPCVLASSCLRGVCPHEFCSLDLISPGGTPDTADKNYSLSWAA